MLPLGCEALAFTASSVKMPMYETSLMGLGGKNNIRNRYQLMLHCCYMRLSCWKFVLYSKCISHLGDNSLCILWFLYVAPLLQLFRTACYWYSPSVNEYTKSSNTYSACVSHCENFVNIVSLFVYAFFNAWSEDVAWCGLHVPWYHRLKSST